MRALFPGRFQPFHYGHLEVVKWALSNWDEVVILVGSGAESHTVINPFTAGERIEMIKRSLDWASIDPNRYVIVPLMENLESLGWATLVQMTAPRFEVIISGNPLVRKVGEAAGYKVVVPPPFNNDQWNATGIRKLMLEGNEAWEKLVPPPVAEFIKQVKGVERIREVSQSDRA